MVGSQPLPLRLACLCPAFPPHVPAPGAPGSYSPLPSTSPGPMNVSDISGLLSSSWQLPSSEHLWVTQPARLVPAPTPQNATGALQATRLTQQGAKVCREVTVMITAYLQVYQVHWTKKWPQKQQEEGEAEETAQVASFSPHWHHHLMTGVERGSGAAGGLGDK